MTQPDLLVIIPAYNKEASVARVIDGIHSHLSQAHVLVVDDGSRDRTGRGAVVTRDVAPHTVVTGVPARPVKTIDGMAPPPEAEVYLHREGLTGVSAPFSFLSTLVESVALWYNSPRVAT